MSTHLSVWLTFATVPTSGTFDLRVWRNVGQLLMPEEVWEIQALTSVAPPELFHRGGVPDGDTSNPGVAHQN